VSRPTANLRRCVDRKQAGNNRNPARHGNT
jgi:hypothetical protein